MKNLYCGITEWDFSWKTSYATIWANNTEWTCSHLFECGKANFDHWQREIFTTNIITALFLVQTLDHWTLITVWVNKPAKESAQGVWTVTHQFECDALAYWSICNSLYSKWQSDTEMTRSRTLNCFYSIWIGTC